MSGAIVIDLSDILAEVRADDAGRCPYCGERNPEGPRDATPPHFAPHAECEEIELRIWAEFNAAEQRVSGVGFFKGHVGFATWGPGTVLTAAAVAIEALEGAVWPLALPACLDDWGWW